MTEQIRVVSRGAEPVTAQLVVRARRRRCGHQRGQVRPRSTAALAATALRGRRRPGGTSGTPRPSRPTPHPAPSPPAAAGGPSVLTFPVSVSPGADAVVTLRVQTARDGADQPGRRRRAHRGGLDGGARRGGRPAPRRHRHRSSFADLQHLLLRDPDDRADVFAGAGTPLVPHAVRPRLALGGADDAAVRHRARRGHPARARPPAGHAASTRRPGEAPGKIPHELRRTTYVDPASGLAPARRSTTARSTPPPLWVSLLHDAWRWGLPADEVEALLPHLRGGAGLAHRPRRPRRRRPARVPRRRPARAWPTRAGRTPATPSAARDGRHRRRRRSRWSRPRRTPSRRADGAAASSTAFGDGRRGRAGASWAAALRRPVPRRGSGSTDAAGRYLAIALDGTARRVDGVASQHGPPARHRPARRRRGGPRSRRPLDRPADARRASASARCRRTTAASTRSATTPARSGPTTPRSCASGLAREGHGAEAAGSWPRPAGLGRGVRLPLAGAVRRRRRPRPSRAVPGLLPAAGLGGRLGRGAALRGARLRPRRPCGPSGAAAAASGALRGVDVRGLRFAGHEFGVRCDADGNVEVLDPPAGVAVDIG